MASSRGITTGDTVVRPSASQDNPGIGAKIWRFLVRVLSCCCPCLVSRFTRDERIPIQSIDHRDVEPQIDVAPYLLPVRHEHHIEDVQYDMPANTQRVSSEYEAESVPSAGIQSFESRTDLDVMNTAVPAVGSPMPPVTEDSESIQKARLIQRINRALDSSKHQSIRNVVNIDEMFQGLSILNLVNVMGEIYFLKSVLVFLYFKRDYPVMEVGEFTNIFSMFLAENVSLSQLMSSSEARENFWDDMGYSVESLSYYNNVQIDALLSSLNSQEISESPAVREGLLADNLNRFHEKLRFYNIREPNSSELNILTNGNAHILNDEDIMSRIVLYLACKRITGGFDSDICYRVVTSDILDHQMVDVVKRNGNLDESGGLSYYADRLKSEIAIFKPQSALTAYRPAVTIEVSHDEPSVSREPELTVSRQQGTIRGMPIPVENNFDIIPGGAASPIVDVKKAFEHEFSTATGNGRRIRRQGAILRNNFYFQKIYGSGNCFYVAYLSGWLHHILRHQAFDETIELLEHQIAYRQDVRRRGAEDHTDFFIDILHHLRRNPSFQTINNILADRARADRLAMYLRDFAVFGVENAVEILKPTGRFSNSGEPEFNYILQELGTVPKRGENWRHLWYEENLIGFDFGDGFEGGILQGNPDLQRRIEAYGDISIENYCNAQRQNYVDIQRPEITILNRYLVPISMYQRLDLPRNELGRAEDGLSPYFNANNPIVIFRSPNHFDLLIRK